MEVAIFFKSSGNCSDVWLTFMPMPMITQLDSPCFFTISHNNPHTFLSLISMSFGHFKSACWLLNSFIVKAAEMFLKFGPGKIIIKRGSNGCVLFSSENSISVGIFPVKNVVDTTGAGDTFGGGYVTGLASGLGETESLILGSALASACVEDFGVQALLSLKNEELIHRQKIIRNSVSS